MKKRYFERETDQQIVLEAYGNSFLNMDILEPD
jgi:hypothetical protein